MVDRLNPNEIPTLSDIDFPENFVLHKLASGKVRERFLTPDGNLLLVTTDRVSAFDVVLGEIPHKGQVLNRLSQFWFENTRDIIPNHMILVPDPNVMVVEVTKPLPVEVVVRGYMKGVSSTSIWPMYQGGQRQMYGVNFREGYQYGDKLDEPIITPTTKATSGHDKPITEREIVESGLVAKEIWEEARIAALSLFERGQELSKAKGLLLIDTKMEFGVNTEGKLMIIDELFTPDSSGFWLAESDLKNPEIYDKEYLRIAYVGMGYRGEGTPPIIPSDLRQELSRRYIQVFERITQETIHHDGENLVDRLTHNVGEYYDR